MHIYQNRKSIQFQMDRKSYSAMKCLKYAKNNGNRSASRHFSVNWRKDEYVFRQTKKIKKTNKGHNARFQYL